MGNILLPLVISNDSVDVDIFLNDLRNDIQSFLNVNSGCLTSTDIEAIKVCLSLWSDKLFTYKMEVCYGKKTPND